METKSYRVKAALSLCYAWYAATNDNIRALTERIDALWLEVDHYVNLMEQAEQEDNRETAGACLERVIYFVTRIQAETHALRV